MRFLLPLHQARPHTLTLLFSQLETQANEMGVTSYGLTACSMEEIFVRLTHKEAAEAPDGKAMVHGTTLLCKLMQLQVYGYDRPGNIGNATLVSK